MWGSSKNKKKEVMKNNMGMRPKSHEGERKWGGTCCLLVTTNILKEKKKSKKQPSLGCSINLFREH